MSTKEAGQWADASDDDGDENPLRIVREPIGGASRTGGAAHSGAVPLVWERRLSLRGKLWRGGLASLVVALVVFALLGGPAAALHALHALRQPSHVAVVLGPPTFSDAPFQWTPPPIGGAHVLTLAVTPSNAAAWASFACWLQRPFPTAQGIGARQLFLAYHANARNNLWTPLPTPNANPSACAVYADATNSRGLLLDLGSAPTETNPCALTTLFASADLGAHWRRLIWPDPALLACGQREALIGGRVYVWADTSLLPPSQRGAANDGRIITSVVGAAGAPVWAPADVGLSNLAALDVIGLRPGGGVLAVGDEEASGQTRMLLASQTAGASWSRRGALPGASPQVFVSSDPTDTAHGGWGRLYELAQSETRGVADGADHLYLASAYLGDDWSPLPLPPPTAAAPASSALNSVMVIGVATDDALLVLRGAAVFNDQAASPSQHLWLWDGAHARWLLDQSLTPENALAFRLAWTQGQATLWVVSAELITPPTIDLLTATFALPASAQQPQRVAGG